MKIYKGNKIIFQYAKYAKNFGLILKRKLREDEAIILQLNKESRLNAIIHMFFVFYPIYVIWLNKDKIIVDIKKAYPFQPFSIPRKASLYVIECCELPDLQLNDRIIFKQKTI